MAKVKIDCAWINVPYEIDLDYPKRIEVLVDKFKRAPVPDDEIRIVVLWEPFGGWISDVMRYPDFYSYVFTYHDFILDNNDKSVLFLGVTVFVDPNVVHNKKFGVSTVIGDKQSHIMPGYKKRHELFFKKDLITIPKEIYVTGPHKFAEQFVHTPYGDIDFSKETHLGERKDIVFDCMFHIAIENSYNRNFFTEKIVDCFLTKTVPIYIGAENIGDFFNKDGIISLKTIDEAIVACNSLTEADYYRMMPAIEDNHQRSQKYIGFNQMLTDKIIEILP